MRENIREACWREEMTVADAVVTDDAEFIERELADTKSELQSTIEELETSNEELQSANEELLSMNEELQSKNEELETVNEELKVTNQELKTKFEEVRQSKGALENLMAATEIATLFLDPDLRLQRFTSAAADLFDLEEADVGRPLSDFTRRFEQEDLLAEARRAFREGESIEREVRLGPEEWHLAKVRPYRTVDREVTGVVPTLVDISEQRLLERELVNTTEKVRRQIGQDLHDILSSDLAALAMMLDNYRNRLAREQVDVPASQTLKVYVPVASQPIVCGWAPSLAVVRTRRPFM